MQNQRASTVFSVLCVVLAACGGEGDGTSAGSEPSALVTGAQPGPGGRHCVIGVNSVRIGEPLPRNAPATIPSCFPTRQEADAFAKGQGLRVDIAVEYADINNGGRYITFYHPDYDCTTHYFYVSALSASWNDVISSAKSFAGCTHSIHYENSNFGGQSLALTTNSAT